MCSARRDRLSRVLSERVKKDVLSFRNPLRVSRRVRYAA